MPLLLSQGPLKLVDPVLKWLGSTFDCFVSPSTLTQEDLLMLAGHYANTGSYRMTVALSMLVSFKHICHPQNPKVIPVAMLNLSTVHQVP